MHTSDKNLQENTYHPLVESLLKARGFTLKDYQDFFSSDLNSLPDLGRLKDLDKAAKRICLAINKGETIGVYGDYDVDGTTSCALLYEFFQLFGIHVQVYQPSRFVEGYGLHVSSIEKALEDEVKVLITVDCGITNHEAAEFATDKDIDLIITDHHNDGSLELPLALAVVNPKRRDEDKNSPLSCLAGVGVAFCLALKIKTMMEKEYGKSIPSLYPLLQFVAVGTVSDLVPLNPMNLKLVRHGLRQLPQSHKPGLKFFFSEDERKETFVPSEKISFQIGPHINSKGRMEHPDHSFKLLVEKDSQQAFEYYSALKISNQERREVQNQVFEEAKQMFLNEITDQLPSICILYSPTWHEGVIGIVASKLVETFKIPSIVLTDADDGESIKGSARSAGELDLYSTLGEFQDLFLKFGGHKAAAGLSLKKENLPLFKKQILTYLEEVPVIERTLNIEPEARVEFDHITSELAFQLESMEPYGMGNPHPLLRIDGLSIKTFDILKEKHVRWNFVSKRNPQKILKGISFNFIGRWGTLTPEQIFARQTDEDLWVMGHIDINRFRGNKFLQLSVKEINF